MLENVVRFVSKIEDKVCHWIIDNNTSIDQAEKMAMQFIQYLGQIRAQQANRDQEKSESKESEKTIEDEKKAEQ